MLDFNGQVVLITGAGSRKGIGRTIAHTFARQGAQVVITDINQAGLDANVQEMKANGWKAYDIAGNICDKESVDALVKTVVDKFGRIDVLVNNAGVSQKVTVADMTLDDMKRIFNVNMFGLFLITQAVCEVMKKQKYGRIVSLSSVSGKRGGGVFGGRPLLRFQGCGAGLLQEFGPGDLRIWHYRKLCVPRPDQHRHLEEHAPGAGRRRHCRHPHGPPGETQEVANAIVFLASLEASYITGEEIDINGGSHMD